MHALIMCIIIHPCQSSTPLERPTADGIGSRRQIRDLCAIRIYVWQSATYTHIWDGRDIPVMPERLFVNAERAFWGDGRVRSGMHERCFGKPERAFPRDRNGRRKVWTNPYSFFIHHKCLRASCFPILLCKDFLLPELHIHAFRYPPRIFHPLLPSSTSSSQ